MRGGALAKGGVHLEDAALDGQSRVVGKPRLSAPQMRSTGGGRAADAAGRRGRRLGGSVWRTRWGDAYWRRPRRVGGAVEGFSDLRGYFSNVTASPQRRAEALDIRLARRAAARSASSADQPVL